MTCPPAIAWNGLDNRAPAPHGLEHDFQDGVDLMTEVAPRIHQLQAVACQVFALLDDDGVTLVDTGAPGSGRWVLRQLRQLGRRPEDVRRIVLTHYHIDHRGAADELRRATGARVYIHASEAPFLRRQTRYPNPVQTPLLRALASPFVALSHGRPVPAVELNDGDTLPTLGGVQVLHTPGHTRGSVALLVPSLGLLLSGDTMGFRRRRLEEPEARVSEDAASARSSLERLAAIDVDTICFSHFQPLRGGARGALEALVATWSEEFRAPDTGRRVGSQEGED